MSERMCSSCGEAIAPARVKAVPSASLCIKCKESEENNHVPVPEPIAYLKREQAFSPHALREGYGYSAQSLLDSFNEGDLYE